MTEERKLPHSLNLRDRSALTLTGVTEVISFDDGHGGYAKAVINPHKTALPYTLDGDWNLVANGTDAGKYVILRESGSVTVDTISIRIYVNDVLLDR